MTEQVKIGVIGGSGLYNMPELTDIERISVETPFGKPSSDVVVGTLRGKRVAFIPRHGEGHVFTPSAVPYRANIFALKKLGVRFIFSANACGSLREVLEPGHIVIPDQIYDNTRHRQTSFFESGLVGHISVADPFSTELSDILYDAVGQSGGTVHRGGCFIIIEGPRFSTRGESNIYRQWGCDIIGMTTVPEAFLAREAEIAFATMAHITDYDVWHEEPVTVDMVIQTLNKNIEIAQQSLANAVEMLDEDAEFEAHSALGNALMTAPDAVSLETAMALRPLVGKYLDR